MDEDVVIGAEIPSNLVEQAVGRLSNIVQDELGTKNGRTALFWHLMAIVKEHILEEG